jgi:hypothetical protein
MSIPIGVTMHAATANKPSFNVYRQETTGAIVLEIGSGGISGDAALFLDTHTLGELHRAVRAGVAAEIARLEDLRDDHADADRMLAATAVFDMLQDLDRA